MIRLLRTYLRPYRGQVVIVLALLLVQALTNLYLPTLNADIINNGVTKGDTGYIVNVGLLMLGVTAILGVASVVTVYFAAKVAMGFGRDVRAAVFRKVGGFSQVEMNHFGTPSLITRNTNDVQQVQMVVFMALTIMILAPITGIGGIIMALREDVPLSGLLVVILPLMVVFIVLVMRRAIPLFRAMQLKIGPHQPGHARDACSGVRVIRAFVRVEHEEQRFDEANLDLFGSAIRVNRLFAVTIPVMTPIMNMSTVAVMWFGAMRVGGWRDADRQPDRLPAVPAADPVLGADGGLHVHLRAARRGLGRAHPRGAGDAADRSTTRRSRASAPGRPAPGRPGRVPGRRVPLPGRRAAGPARHLVHGRAGPGRRPSSAAPAAASRR